VGVLASPVGDKDTSYTFDAPSHNCWLGTSGKCQESITTEVSECVGRNG